MNVQFEAFLSKSIWSLNQQSREREERIKKSKTPIHDLLTYARKFLLVVQRTNEITSTISYEQNALMIPKSFVTCFFVRISDLLLSSVQNVRCIQLNWPVLNKQYPNEEQYSFIFHKNTERAINNCLFSLSVTCILCILTVGQCGRCYFFGK